MRILRRRQGSAAALLAACALAGVSLTALGLTTREGNLLEPAAISAPIPDEDLEAAFDATFSLQSAAPDAAEDPGFPGDGSDEILKD